MKTPSQIAGYAVEETAHSLYDTLHTGNAWSVPRCKEVFEVKKGEYVLRLENENEDNGLWISGYYGQPLGAVINKDLVKAAERGNFHQAIIPPLIASGAPLWGQDIKPCSDFLFTVAMGYMSWEDLFGLWLESRSKEERLKPFELQMVPKGRESFRVFPEHSLNSRKLIPSDSKQIFSHVLRGGGTFFKGKVNHPTLGMINSDPQYGPTMIVEGTILVDNLFSPTSQSLPDLTGCPHLICVMNGFVRQLSIRNK
ncbi:MAG: hypothetical protein WCI52_01935 [bacterium]